MASARNNRIRSFRESPIIIERILVLPVTVSENTIRASYYSKPVGRFERPFVVRLKNETFSRLAAVTPDNRTVLFSYLKTI